MQETGLTRRAAWLCVALVVAVLGSGAAAQSDSSTWFKAGDHPADYDMGLDRNTAFTGSSSGYIKSHKPDPQGFGTYMQVFDAAEYRGKRLRLSAYVKAENVANWAGLWMRIDREKKAVAFDNMQGRPITASQEWTQHAIVLDVDSNATAVAFGILLAGKGAVWIDDLAFDVVGQDVPVTDMTLQSRRPRNLDFESGPAKQ
jgi:RNA polymerase subunit RPABC4/transcription elongation factor Spt4